jgi:hypothetical protein
MQTAINGAADTLKILVPLLSGTFGALVTLVGNHFYLRWKARKEKRETIFRTLMSTRGFKIHPTHVDALCQVEIEWRRAGDAKVKSAWKAYSHHLNTTAPQPVGSPANSQWCHKLDDLFADLAVALSESIGSTFDKTDVKVGAYGPTVWWEIEEEWRKIRKGVINVLESGKGLAVPVLVSYDEFVQHQLSEVTEKAKMANSAAAGQCVAGDANTTKSQ